MKLYLFLLSIFLVRVIGLFYYLSFIFAYNFFLHIENRMSFYKEKYKNNMPYRILEKIVFFKKNMLTNIDNSQHFDNFYYYLITNNYVIPIINFYNSAEFFYLFILDEIFLMFYTLTFSLFNNIIASSIKKKSNIKEIQISKLSDSSLADSDSDSFTEDNNQNNNMNSNNYTDINLIDRLKKKNNIDASCTNNINLDDTINCVNNLLYKLNSDVNNFKDKDL